MIQNAIDYSFYQRFSHYKISLKEIISIMIRIEDHTILIHYLKNDYKKCDKRCLKSPWHGGRETFFNILIQKTSQDYFLRGFLVCRN